MTFSIIGVWVWECVLVYTYVCVSVCLCVTFSPAGLSPKEGFQSQKILGKVTVERAQMVAFEMLVDSHFINPLLQMSKPLVSYSWT